MEITEQQLIDICKRQGVFFMKFDTGVKTTNTISLDALMKIAEETVRAFYVQMLN